MIFFFKQKTAYEMRISDWSSDVCSSDLEAQGVRIAVQRRRADKRARAIGLRGNPRRNEAAFLDVGFAIANLDFRAERAEVIADGTFEIIAFAMLDGAGIIRSEEHTSELQSIMRNSYAVICLKQ